MGAAVIGSLLQFDCEKRQLFHPNAPLYEVFDGVVGLCTNHRVNDRGVPYVRVEWLKPVCHAAVWTKSSSFALDNFIVVGKVHGKK
jgi:hypothetical protein